MRRISLPGWLVIAGTAIGVVLLDQLSKAWVERNLAIYESLAPIPAFSKFFTFTHFTNTGAAFGLLRDQNILFVVIGIVVVASIYVYSKYLPHDQLLVQFALGLQLGGALGNIIDRVRQGHVTDFIYFHFWPAFNIADSAVVIGVILLGVAILRQPQEGQSQAAVEADSGEQRV
ncbi:MAG: signal peptidase II [Caldilineales bacterium]